MKLQWHKYSEWYNRDIGFVQGGFANTLWATTTAKVLALKGEELTRSEAARPMLRADVGKTTTRVCWRHR